MKHQQPQNRKLRGPDYKVPHLIIPTRDKTNNCQAGILAQLKRAVNCYQQVPLNADSEAYQPRSQGIQQVVGSESAVHG